MSRYCLPDSERICRKLLKISACGVLSALLCTALPVAASSIFNPRPLPGDLILPLPCAEVNPQYQMVFRKIYTHVDPDSDATHSFEFTDGTTNYGSAAIQSPRQCQVRGNFHDAGGNFFYLAKYELTTGQYDAIVKHKCSHNPDKLEALAKAEISIDEAREVARLYSDFLQTVSSTPSMGSELASATLPYECYWSFAQRGGLAVTRAQLESDLPYLGPSLNLKDYAWGFGSDSANGKVQLIGRKIPNALGLFDMLGNVQEYIDEPFQATGSGGLIAQKGGSTVRGGSFLTPFPQMTSSMRTEKKRYTNRLPTRSKDTGMRLMLSVSVTVDAHHLKELEEAVRKQPPVPVTTAAASKPPAGPQLRQEPADHTAKAPEPGKSPTPEPDHDQTLADALVAVMSGTSTHSEQESEERTDTSLSESSREEEPVLTISDAEARQHLNEHVTVCGRVAQITELANLTYLNFENSFPYQTLVVFLTNADKYGEVQQYLHRRVCATGFIKLVQESPRITNPAKLMAQ